MHIFTAAASLAAALLVAASASAGEPPPSPSPSTPAPAAPAAPPAAAPLTEVTAPPAAAPPVYPAPPPPGLGYATPYAVYGAPGQGAPYPYWMGTRPVTERRSNSMRITGIVLFSVGGLVSAAGATIFGIGANCVNEDIVFADDAPLPGPAPASARGQGGRERIGTARQALNTCNMTTPGLGLLVGGLVTAVAGIPLFVIGSKQVPMGSAGGTLLPAVTVGAGNASLRWTF